MSSFQSINIHDTVTKILVPYYNVQVCNWCHIKGSATELFCDCKIIIKSFGALSCTNCNSSYGTFETYDIYLKKWGGQKTYDNYYRELINNMEPPCSCSLDIYRLEFQTKLDTFTAWKIKNFKKYDGRITFYNEIYEDRCRSGKNGICPCCGD